ncbi:glycosyltransferase [Bacteroidales bacterium OttesenSCG-928-I14]|nr:glycosyltransferase [Bacteroidales bacterium OttesenSCG-928-I14]
MKILFVIQGEGRGHMTQAIALKEILEKNGHELVAALVGKSKRRELPDFVKTKLNVPIYRFDSPNFVPSPRNKRANVWRTIALNFIHPLSYINSIKFIREKINETDADVVVNFYDMLTGLAYMFFPPKRPHISVSHQNLFLHPKYRFPQENKSELLMLRIYTHLTTVRASRRYALSMEKWEDVPQKKIIVVPPLLRREVLDSEVTAGNYVHGYMLNPGYADQIIDFQKAHPEQEMHFFWDKKDVDDTFKVNDKLFFHKINDMLFIKYMSGCYSYATTAGFESVCEAMYMGKPALMVPTHIEQACNGYEASLAGAGIMREEFDLEALSDFAKDYEPKDTFREWVGQAETYWSKELLEWEKNVSKLSTPT